MDSPGVLKWNRKRYLAAQLSALLVLGVIAVCTADEDNAPDNPAQVATKQQEATATGTPLLRLASGANKRYFVDVNGSPVYLTGSHTWNNLQDSPAYVPPIFDFTAYLNKMSTAWGAPTIGGSQPKHRVIRLWANERYESVVYTQNPFMKDGPGTDQAGYAGKWDFSTGGCQAMTPTSTVRFDQTYFDRLRNRVSAAQAQGLYVIVMLFQGWSPYPHSSAREQWINYWFNPANNCNGINGGTSLPGFVDGMRAHTLDSTESHPTIWAIQKAYMRKVVDTVNAFDNVLYEISNEDGWWTNPWQDAMITEIRHYEAGKPKQHVIGKTAFGSGDLDPPAGTFDFIGALTNSAADWISIPQSNSDNPTGGPAHKVNIDDTDHNNGLGSSNRSKVWKSFMRGNNPIFMDGLHGDMLTNTIDNPARQAMGQSLVYADKVNLVHMTPQNDASSPSTTRYALYNNTTSPYKYLVYQPSGGNEFTVSCIPAATYTVEWFNVESGVATTSSNVTNPSSFTPPSGNTEGWVLLLRSTGGDTNLLSNREIESAWNAVQY